MVVTKLEEVLKVLEACKADAVKVDKGNRSAATRLRKDAAGKTVPAWFIKTLNVKAQGKDVLNAEFGTAVSKDPFLNFKYKGSKGDKLSVTWVDTKGEKRTDEILVS